MKWLLTVTTIFSTLFCHAQEVDSAWIQQTYFPALSTDTGKVLPHVNLVDETGKKRSLSEFAGKVLYIDVWTTWCVNCLANFPRSKKLHARLRSIHLDTAIQFINICTEDSKADWKKALKKYQPKGINLYATDTASIYKKWKIDAFPRYLVLDRNGKIMSQNGVDVRDGTIDYILYAATKGIKPANAMWTAFRQSKYYRTNHHYTNNKEGADYSKWFNSIAEKLVADANPDAVHRANNDKLFIPQ